MAKAEQKQNEIDMLKARIAELEANAGIVKPAPEPSTRHDLRHLTSEGWDVTAKEEFVAREAEQHRQKLLRAGGLV